MNHNVLNIVLLLLLFLIRNYGYNLNFDKDEYRSCPPKLNSTTPYFPPNEYPPKMIDGKNDEFLDIACMDGYSSFYWDFYSLLHHKWSNIPSANIQTDERVISYNRPYQYTHSGYYRCTGVDDYNNSLSAKIFVYVFIKDSRHLRIEKQNDDTQVQYPIGATITKVCNGTTYYPDIPITVYWYVKKDNRNSILNTNSHFNIKTNIIYANNKSLNTNLFEVNITSQLIIKKSSFSDTGYYVCFMNQSNVSDRIDFEVIIEFPAAYIAIIMSCLLAVGIILLIIRMNFYRMIVFYKTYLDSSSKFPFDCTKKFDVAIFNVENDVLSVQAAREICQSLEFKKYKCWLNARDKIYGMDYRLSLQKVANESHSVLIILSRPSLERSFNIQSVADNYLEILNALAALQAGLTITKMYLFFPSRKVIIDMLSLQSGQLEQWLKMELRVRKICCLSSHKNMNTDILKINETSNNFESIIPWIIASLPGSVLRRVQQSS